MVCHYCSGDQWHVIIVVIVSGMSTPTPTCSKQATEELEVQAELRHELLEIVAVTLYLLLPKLRPVTVTAASMLVGAFRGVIHETTGASNEIISSWVPATAETVT